MAPHTTGANAGPKVIMQPPVAMAPPSLFLGVTARMVFIMSGMNRPEPIACTRRATMSSAKLPANRPSADPASVKAAPAKNSTRSANLR